MFGSIKKCVERFYNSLLRDSIKENEKREKKWWRFPKKAICSGGLSIGLGPILHFGTEELRQRIAPPCCRGEKIISLCITEPSAGTAGITCEAKKTPDRKFYIVNGEKKGSQTEFIVIILPWLFVPEDQVQVEFPFYSLNKVLELKHLK